MEKEPLISIVMPLYNAEKYVDVAIQSVIEQTFLDWELIIVDDKSTDNSGKICDVWAEKEHRIKIIHLLENKGAGNARNVGIEEARGKYLTFLDSDDKIAKDLYEKVLQTSLKYDIDVFVWGVTEQYFDQKGNVIRENVLTLPTKLYLKETDVRKQVILLEDKTLFGYQWNHLYKLEIVKQHKIYFEPVVLYEDYFFNLAFINYVNSMCVVNNAGYYYAKRMNQSITNKYVSDYFVLSKRRVSEMVNAYKCWGLLDNQVKESCGNRYLRYIASALMRNNDGQAQMSLKEKRAWIKTIFSDRLYLAIAKECKAHGILLNIIQKLIDLKMIEGCLILGKVLYLIKYRFPYFFSRKSIVK